MVKSQEIDEFLVQLLTQVGNELEQDVKKRKDVNTKSSRNDLVTNFDKSIEKMIVEKIKDNYPEATIVSEEGYGDSVTSMKGLVFFVDPIDGTMNFVRSRDSFASMIGVYLDDKPLVSGILNMLEKTIIHGGPDLGVKKDDQEISLPENTDLAEGLVVISGPMVLENKFDTQSVVHLSSGLRIFGSAGIVFEHLILGREVLYMSYLRPWDLAAGRVFCEALGLKVVGIDGKPVNMLQSQVVIAGTKNVVSEVLKTVKN